MKIQFNKFVCDNCQKQSEIVEDNPKCYPYEKDWIYLYDFKCKIRRDLVMTITDKHFCCQNCVLLYIQDKIKELRNIKVNSEEGVSKWR